MTWEEYKDLAMRTANKELDNKTARKYCLLKLMGEAGEVADAYGKYIGQGHSEEWLKATLIDELGDVFWYIAYYESLDDEDPKTFVRNLYWHWHQDNLEKLIFDLVPEISEIVFPSLDEQNNSFYLLRRIAELIGSSVEEVWQRNIEKLRHRYPEGFDPDRSKMRYEVEGQIG